MRACPREGRSWQEAEPRMSFYTCSTVPLDFTHTLKIRSLTIQKSDFKALNFVRPCDCTNALACETIPGNEMQRQYYLSVVAHPSLLGGMNSHVTLADRVAASS